MTWRDTVYDLASVLPTLPRGRDEGLRAALVTLWRTLNDAPDGVKSLYGNLSEASVAEAAEIAGDVNAPDFGFRVQPDLEDKDLVRALAASIRALENVLIAGSTQAPAVNPEQDWRVAVEGRSFYLIPFPRPKGGPQPEKDFRPFSKRGVKSFRILPCEIGEYPIRLVQPDVVGHREEIKFGAALFDSIAFSTELTSNGFLVTGVSSPGLPSQIEEHLARAHIEHCAAAVFPELTIDPNSRKQIQKLLSESPWLERDPKNPWQALDFVMAGSWHEQDSKGKFANVATVFGGEGEELFRHQKLFAFRDKKDGLERIEIGKSITVLVLRRTLYAFGICLDFCQKLFDGSFGKLDVDFIVVASCGNDGTMEGHIESAKIMSVRFDTRPFVVQQAYPKLPYPELQKEGHGFVLGPSMTLKALSAGECVTAHTWQVYTAPPL